MITFYKLKEEDLRKKEIIEALRNGRVMLMVENNNIGKQRMIDKAYNMIKPAQKLINKNHNMINVRMCLNAIADALGEDFTLHMQSETKCERLVCNMVGAMLGVGLFTNTAMQLAQCLELKRNSRSSARCRIDEGKRDSRLTDILLEHVLNGQEMSI